jgi:hypothetical protein
MLTRQIAIRLVSLALIAGVVLMLATSCGGGGY